jgi:ABC-2 type transport system permease protein
MWERILQVVIKECRQMFRDTRMRIMLFAQPVVQLTLFGFAVNLDVDRVPMGWFDADRTPASRELLSGFEGSGRFYVVALPATDAEAQQLLDGGEVDAIVRVLPGFARDLQRGHTANVEVLIDGTNSNIASLVSSYASEVVSRFSSVVLEQRVNTRLLTVGGSAPAAIRLPGVEARARIWFNPELRSRFYFVPGVLVTIMMIVTISLTALAIVREKEIGTMEQLMVSPLRPIELMLGKTLPFALVGMVQVFLVVGAALVVFRVPFRGNPLLLLASAFLYLMTTIGAGLFISTISRTQHQAMMAMFFFVVPAFILSGFAFPIQNMPVLVQYLTYLDPLRYFMEIVRGIFLKGTGFSVLWPQLLALGVYGSGIIALSAIRFRKTLD